MRECWALGNLFCSCHLGREKVKCAAHVYIEIHYISKGLHAGNENFSVQ